MSKHKNYKPKFKRYDPYTSWTQYDDAMSVIQGETKEERYQRISEDLEHMYSVNMYVRIALAMLAKEGLLENE